MPDSESEKRRAQLEPELRDMKIGEGTPQPAEGDGALAARVKVEDDQSGRAHTPKPTLLKVKSRSPSTSPSPAKPHQSNSSSPEHTDEEVVGGDITLKMSPGKAPKLSRTASHKFAVRDPLLFFDLPDSTEEAKATFAVLSECTYGNKNLGTTEQAWECDCQEEWGKLLP